MLESIDPQQCLGGRYLRLGAFRYDEADYQAEDDYDDAWDDYDERYDDDDDEPPGASMARVAAEIEAGRAEVPRGWKLNRPAPGVLVWTTPSGRRYAFTLAGDYLPLPGPGPAGL